MIDSLNYFNSEQEKIEEGKEAAETMAGEEKQRETEVKEEPKEMAVDKYVFLSGSLFSSIA